MPLSRFMSRLNNFLFSVSLPTQFATAQLYRIDGAGNLHYANAAHPPSLLFRRATGGTTFLDQPSHLLGAMPEMPFEEQCTTVEPGDTLFVYTDGLTDRRNTAGEFYSIERIASLLEASPDGDLSTLYDSIYADVTGFAATDEFRDDIAFVVTRFH
jgi:sigma-B regulation protein RsbU (phosphoserine phosphatase)